MDLERVLYKKMTKDELIDKLIAYKNIECHDRAIAHEFLCMQKEDPSRMNFVTHRLTDIADPKRVAEEIRRVKAERTASAQQPIKDELTDTIPVYVTLYKNIRLILKRLSCYIILPDIVYSLTVRKKALLQHIVMGMNSRMMPN